MEFYLLPFTIWPDQKHLWLCRHFWPFQVLPYEICNPLRHHHRGSWTEPQFLQGQCTCRNMPWWRRWRTPPATDRQTEWTQSTLEDEKRGDTKVLWNTFMPVVTTGNVLWDWCDRNTLKLTCLGSFAISATISTMKLPTATVSSQPACSTAFMLLGALKTHKKREQK